MKKVISLLAMFIMVVGLFVGCGSGNSKKIPDELVVYFVPSREPQEIITATEPLKDLLKTELKNQGYDFKDIKIEVGTTYEAVGEALTAGTAHVGFIPGGTYVLYADGADPILTATRNGLSIDSKEPADWNKAPTTNVDKQVTYYKALIVAGPSAKGKELAAKINSGQKLTADDMKSAKWGVMGASSSAGYIYPSLWLKDNFGLKITDLPNVVQNNSYGDAMTRLASEQLDVICEYADARIDYADKWEKDYARKDTIWKETNIIGVTDNIYNDTISVSKSSNAGFIDDNFKKALQTAFIDIAKTPEGQKVISIYSHKGYEVADPKNYEAEKKAQDLIKEMNNK
ncbi:phosphonate ABC transporter, periplasmic phosphonate-binding protein [Clostridium sp. DL-VIII]|uniref:phosphate/phosphite/phosphonate ABC transporter substrate-binding protein n=1 Tax=Clostridium sp. DL-VIII TaxID=641107 RepID=UPI00023B07FC|nr:PhnD/SsuA/transferrin family substrate-binding protein [Clostridium sp. DL-VIII]EHJ02181.1 phosphonate ABC transporter, periplasmic phosphonate-binding protein [Clostridium sp. DL-VIII]